MKYRLLILVFWLTMSVWLVRFEAFPEKFEALSSGYSAILSRDTLVMDSWMRILFKDTPIGYSHTRMDINEDSSTEHYAVENKVHLRLQMMGEKQDVHVETEVFLDTAQRLQRFGFVLSSRGLGVRVSGRRRLGQSYAIEIKTGASLTQTTLEIPDDAVIYSPMTEMAMRRLQPGEKLVMRVLDPASLATADITVRAERKERISFRNGEREATLLSMDYLGLKMQSWIDADGNVLRETTPFGWNMEQCTPEEAFASIKGSAAPDLLAGMAVPCKGSIPDSREARELTLRLRGADFADSELRSERQTRSDEKPNELTLVVRAAELQNAGGRMPETDFARHLRPTAWVQSDHPDILRTAARVVGTRTNALDKAIAICDWTHAEIRKEMTVSLPSAIDVLREMAGDCNEHTYLFVALARAAGLPARIHVGLAYYDGAFYYHAWPAVFVGHWVEMDPTWGQHAVDATHIAIVEGELANQIQLARIMGRLSIEVVAQKGLHDRHP